MLQKLKSRILVVDDDAHVCELLSRIFEESGRYSVESQTDPFAAMATARHYRPDIIFLDIRMPGIGGLEIATEMRAEPVLQDRPIVLFTGIEDRDPAILAVAVGSTEYLAKGASAEEILATADRLLAAAGSALQSSAS